MLRTGREILGRARIERGGFGLGCMIRRLHAGMVMRLAALRSQELRVTSRPVLVVAPHQDDETFGCGGLIALKRLAGVRVAVVFLTDGGRSHDQHADLEPANLGGERRREALAAMRILGIDPADVHFLNYPDGGLHSLEKSARSRLVDELIALISRYGAGEILLPHRHDRHLDHEAAFSIVADAAVTSGANPDLLQYSIWMPWRSPLLWRMRPKDISNAHRLSIDVVRMRKQKAIGAYQSQLQVLPWCFAGQFNRPYEIYFKLKNTEAGMVM